MYLNIALCLVSRCFKAISKALSQRIQAFKIAHDALLSLFKLFSGQTVENFDLRYYSSSHFKTYAYFILRCAPCRFYNLECYPFTF